jgi:hypothetical protein
MSRQPWLTSELGVLGALRQSVELCRTGFARVGLTILLTSLVTGLVLGALVLRERTYAPRFALRVVEARQQTDDVRPLKRQLREYVRQAVFTSAPLLELMRRHGLYPRLAQKNVRAALESFREDIEIEVYQNYFVEERAAGSSPRSARLTVSFRDKDPARALAVTRDLGKLIVEQQRAFRREQVLAMASSAERARDTLVDALRQRSAEIVSKEVALERGAAPNPRLQVELVGLLGSVPALERQVDAADRRAASLGLEATLERHGMGMSFEVVDEGSLPARGGRARALLVAGLSTFVLGLPLIATAVGAFATSKRGTA